MARIISVLFVLIASLIPVAHAASSNEPLELAANAPSRHVVVKGDTLWAISREFLKDPFRWPELWGMNKYQIKNPHWIYPGQVLVLDMSSGQPRLRIEGAGSGDVPTIKVQPEVRITDQLQAIPAIPQQVIEPFLSQPLVAEDDSLENTPRIIATQEGRDFSGYGDLAYVKNLPAGAAPVWQIYRPGKALIDPDTKALLGHEAIMLGTARLVKNGDPATVRIAGAKEEIGKNDRLVPAPNPDIVSYPLHRPTTDIKVRVISVYGDSAAGGRYSIVALTGGERGGLDLGAVLALYRTGKVITDRYQGHKENVTLPDERYGLVYVFRNFKQVSYGLVMEASRLVEAGDTARAP